MNPSFFGKNLLLIFSESISTTDKSNVNFRILISSASWWANQILFRTNATADMRENMILTDKNTFLLLRFFKKKFRQLCLMFI